MQSSNAKLVKTANRLREAIPKMSKLNIPLTPENYHTWYEYTMESNQELNNAINKLLENNETFTSKVNSDLYYTYVKPPLEDSLKTFQQEMQEMARKLFEKINGMTVNTQNYSASLEEYSNVLQQKPDISAITELITNLIDKTDSVLQSNQYMENSLEFMGEEVVTLRDKLQSLHVEAFTDQLTAVNNRRAFDKKLDELFNHFYEKGKIFSLLIIDIDHFKKFNDMHGHAVGDRVLKYVAGIMKGAIKGDDMLARYGGEEFTILLPETNYDAAIAVANNVRLKIMDKNLVDKHENGKSLGHITVSIGVAVSDTNDDDESIIERADKSLYLAKDRGRNLVVGEHEV